MSIGEQPISKVVAGIITVSPGGAVMSQDVSELLAPPLAPLLWGIAPASVLPPAPLLPRFPSFSCSLAVDLFDPHPVVRAATATSTETERHGVALGDP
ncbi:MAG TPA: hypothetical protein VHC69_33460 [Polyangiaceae bacterium]|nr:hypothetical protein [Polyangiaceae bacterium]